MFIAGLTGNYGMGKSAVLQMFRELGAVAIDADWVVGQLLKEKKVLAQIKKLLGAGVFDRQRNIDKKKVSEKIFKNKTLRLKLEDIIHPPVFERIDDFIKKLQDDKRIIIVEAPLIFERGYEKKFDKMITVFTSETIAVNRLLMLGITPKQAFERIKCQLSIKEKIKRADYTIDNSDLPEKTRRQVESVYKKLLKEAVIKCLIFEGKVDRAAKILGKPFSIEGKVIKGAGRGGKLLHTPTANIAVEKAVPLKEGVYAVRVAFGSKTYDAVANIGKNPTFGDMPVSYEVHIFNFSGNLLGKKIRVDFIARIRDEKKFPNVKALETQIKKDIKKAKGILKAA